MAQSKPSVSHEDAHGNTSLLGPILCWAVVFADIGTSIYYVPGILYATVGKLAAFFVALTLIVFILLTLKYTEVTHLFPQGGGVVTVAAESINRWFGALGGMFILVDYFLTAAISSLSAMQYLSVIIVPLGVFLTIPGIGSIQVVLLVLTILVLLLLGVLNWYGVSESAKVSLIGALIAFVSDIVILITVFTHISPSVFIGLIAEMFHGVTLTPKSFLVGFSGAFLAFSGLESISQLSPIMKHPHKKVAGLAMIFVVITVGFTSPLLTLFSTILLQNAASDPVLSSQLISLLGGKWGGWILQTEVALSAVGLLVFASNTAIIGSYHVFIALSRMEFLPSIILKKNKKRGTPHFAIGLATCIPIIILILVKGQIAILGDMYAFGLLAAFTLTCLGLDIIRFREWNELKGIWAKTKFYLGILTTVLVALAWVVNLVTKPLATEFGVIVSGLGLVIAITTRILIRRKQGATLPLLATQIDMRLRNSVLVVMTNGKNDAVIQAGARSAYDLKKPVVFVYFSAQEGSQPEFMGIQDSYRDNDLAKEAHRKAVVAARDLDLDQHHVYEVLDNPLYIEVGRYSRLLHPVDTVISNEIQDADKILSVGVVPERVRSELTKTGVVNHLLRRDWKRLI